MIHIEMSDITTKIPSLHPWNLDPGEAASLQLRLRSRLVYTWDNRPVRSIGGVDLGYSDRQACAAIVVLSYPEMGQISIATATGVPAFPYLPSLLAFREGPLILEAWQMLTIKPDLLMFDGHGIAHSRGMGIASQLGLWLGIPTIGVAKSLLYGNYTEVGRSFGDSCELLDEYDPSKIIGAVLRTREKSKPIFISPGHLIDLENALKFVLSSCQGHRLPEPIRRADHLVKTCR